jgi:glycosyltransferase involved in cell wall biosynthesis
VRVVRIVTRLNRGGPLRQLQALVPGLARAGVGGPVWTGAPGPGEEDAAADLARLGVEVVRVPGLVRGISPSRDARAWRWMRARLARERPDLVHTHLGKAGALGRLAARDAGVPLVVHTFHGHHFAAPWPAGPLARRAERVLARATDALVCLSPRQRADVVERFRVAPAARVAVVPPGLDVHGLRAAVDPARAAALRARWGGGAGVVVLWLGRFVEVKAPRALLDALERAPAGAFRLVMAGDGPLRGEAVAHARARRLLGRVAFPGGVADPATWIAACDAVVLASRSEGTPLALLEAMALGRPVVSTAVGGVPDVVEDEATGLLVPPGNAPALGWALGRLAGDPALRARLGAEGAARAEARFGAHGLVEGTRALYERLGGERRRRGGPAA